jgi:hypothetical protein
MDAKQALLKIESVAASLQDFVVRHPIKACLALLSISMLVTFVYMRHYTVVLGAWGSPEDKVRQFVSIGMPFPEAITRMERAGFTCQSVRRYQFGNDLKDGQAVHCIAHSRWWLLVIPVPWTWQFDLADDNGKVGHIQGYTPVF